MSCIKVSNLGKVWWGWSFRGLTVLIILPLVLILTFGTIGCGKVGELQKAVERIEHGDPITAEDWNELQRSKEAKEAVPPEKKKSVPPEEGKAPESISEVELQKIPKEDNETKTVEEVGKEIESKPETDEELRARAKRELATSPSTGEPVPGADIFIEQEPDDEPIVSTTTDSNGNFSLTLMLHPGTYTIHFENATITAPGNKGGFAIGGFNAAIIEFGDSQEQDGDRVSFEVVTAYSNGKESALTKADSKKYLLSINGEDKTTLVRIIVPKNKAPKKWRLEGSLVCVPAKKVVRFKAGSDLSKTVK